MSEANWLKPAFTIEITASESAPLVVFAVAVDLTRIVSVKSSTAVPVVAASLAEASRPVTRKERSPEPSEINGPPTLGVL